VIPENTELSYRIMNRDQVLKKLASVNAINTPSAIFNEILNLVDKPDVSNQYLTKLVLKDSALTARLLKIANSAAYGIAHEVTSVNQAIMVMGLNAVKLYILSISVFNQVKSQNKPSQICTKSLWKHILEVASASQQIAKKIKYPVAEEAYVAGLLHDIGILLLLDNFEAEYNQVIIRAAGGIDLIEAETLVFGIDHQEVAEYITERWNMPKVLRQPISFHHVKNIDSVDDLPQLSKIVALSDCIAQVPFEQLDQQYTSKSRILALESLSRSLHLAPETIQAVYSKLHEEVSISADMFDLDTGDALEILTESNSRLFKIYLELTSLFKERQELSRQMLADERMEGSIESLKISLATLSHYINNATMNIQGNCEIMQLYLEKDEHDNLIGSMPKTLSSMRKSVFKISLVLEELANLTSMENLNFFHHSRAIDIEKKLKESLTEQLEKVKV